MTISAQDIESEALSLPGEERTRLAIHLLESIGEWPRMDQQQIELARVAEANRRYLAYLRDEEQSIPADEVFAELRADDC